MYKINNFRITKLSLKYFLNYIWLQLWNTDFSLHIHGSLKYYFLLPPILSQTMPLKQSVIKLLQKYSIHLAFSLSPVWYTRWPSSSSSTFLDLLWRWLFCIRQVVSNIQPLKRDSISEQNTPFPRRGFRYSYIRQSTKGHGRLMGANSNSIPRNSHGTQCMLQKKNMARNRF